MNASVVSALALSSTIPEASLNTRIADAEVAQVTEAHQMMYASIIEGAYTESDRVQIEYLGDVDNLYDVVEITETLSSRTARSGEVVDDLVTTRVASTSSGSSSGTEYVDSITITASIYFQKRTNNKTYEIQLKSYSVTTSSYSPSVLVTSTYGNYGQIGANRQATQSGTFTGITSASGNTGFTTWQTHGGDCCFTSINATVEYRSLYSTTTFSYFMQVYAW